MKILYYDCFAGISGDMNLGALLDVGVGQEYLKKELKKLNVKGYELLITKEKKNGISGTRVNVKLTNKEHHHRRLDDIKRIITSGSLNKNVQELSIKIFKTLAQAEAKIHNKNIEEIHFHEVGAIDAIIDIVGAAICLDYLNPDKILCSTIECGSGMIECVHGTFPVPAPATIEILQNTPIKSSMLEKETTTPTGAAILVSCVDEFTDEIELNIKKTGYGIGYHDLKIPNVLRVYIAETKEKNDQEMATIIECNIDDMNPEYYDFVIEKLFEKGAHDVYLTPVIMKKSRPAVKLSVLCNANSEKDIEEVLFMETSTLGIRKYLVQKQMLKREIKTIESDFGKVKVKMAYYKGKLVNSKPEYEDCLKIAKENKLTLKEVYKSLEKNIQKIV